MSLGSNCENDHWAPGVRDVGTEEEEEEGREVPRHRERATYPLPGTVRLAGEEESADQQQDTY